MKSRKNILIFFRYEDMEVEFDCQECNLKFNYQIIRSNGKVYDNWNSQTSINK